MRLFAAEGSVLVAQSRFKRVDVQNTVLGDMEDDQENEHPVRNLARAPFQKLQVCTPWLLRRL